MTRQSIFKQLFAAYPGAKITVETVAMYAKLLADIPDDELQVVVDQAVATCKFVPTIAEIREIHRSVVNPALLTWGDGWDAVQKEIRRIGSYGRPEFQDPIVARVVRSMGWRELCMSENPGVDRAQFRDMYNALVARHESELKLLPATRTLSVNGGMMSIGALMDSVVSKSKN